jgi:hypothetical protein
VAVWRAEAWVADAAAGAPARRRLVRSGSVVVIACFVHIYRERKLVATAATTTVRIWLAALSVPQRQIVRIPTLRGAAL